MQVLALVVQLLELSGSAESPVVADDHSRSERV